ncbi:MAG: glycoside hydrolase family 127 protein [Trueperaceae bacterium]|nr:glycoside hydrolase family 127 protein [Trueperaceae bacterium]
MSQVVSTKPKPAIVVDTSKSPYALLHPVALNDVRLKDEFWLKRQKFNREVTLPSQFDSIEATGGLDNFRRVSGRKEGESSFYGFYFNDTDIYKWLEAASYILATERDPELERMMDICITELAAAQRDDGYLDTFYELERHDERFTNPDMHELYCAGHLFQAAVAHYRATGEDRLINVARRFADFICNTFGTRESGKRPWVDGHEEVKLGLIEMYRATGEQRYLDQAQYFVEARGYGLARRKDPEYCQDHKPFKEMDAMVGHAVRAVYYTSAVADLYAERGDEDYKETLEHLWKNMTEKRMYVTGGIGARYDFEAFGKDYELTSERAYTETCAAIGSVMWNWRMLALEGEAKYTDLLEWTIYNAILSGWSLDGRGYFYQNPLADDGTHRRQTWFYCACCPPNISRLVASFASYIYSVSDNTVWLHLFADSQLDTTLPSGQKIKLSQQSNYPWEGKIGITIESAGEFSLKVRIPGWCDRAPDVTINGQAVSETVKTGSYLELSRNWQAGDSVELDLPLEIKFLEAHPYVLELKDQIAVTRGPLVYCLEEVDNKSFDLRDFVVSGTAKDVRLEPSDDLGGVTKLKLEGEVHKKAFEGLYRPVEEAKYSASKVSVTAIPYYVWANREPGRMQVWMKNKI